MLKHGASELEPFSPSISDFLDDGLINLLQPGPQMKNSDQWDPASLKHSPFFRAEQRFCMTLTAKHI